MIGLPCEFNEDIMILSLMIRMTKRRNGMMSKKRTRRKHSVRADMQFLELARAGSSIEFAIYADKEKIGRIIIGRGSFAWYGRNRKKGRRFSWTRFAQLMDKAVYAQ